MLQPKSQANKLAPCKNQSFVLASLSDTHKCNILTHRQESGGGFVRTNIEIDDRLMAEAMQSAGTKTKRETVEEGLRMLIKIKRQTGIRKFRGKIKWEGNLDELRSGREW